MFNNAFLSYSTCQLKSKIKDITEEENQDKTQKYENKPKTKDLSSNFKSGIELFGQIINCVQIDSDGDPILKKNDDDTITYYGRLFVLYPSISSEIKAIYRCQYNHKNESKLQEAG